MEGTPKLSFPKIEPNTYALAARLALEILMIPKFLMFKTISSECDIQLTSVSE
jgi:hypothetical protein